jgi:simple sugar transport system substrate-binding protein
MDFAIDQQPYLQGFLPVQMMSLYLKYGFVPAQQLTATGPSLITPSNVATYATYAKEGVR